MTREEAIQFLDNMKHEEAGRAIGKDGFYAELMGYHVEALNMAIKALEQEPTVAQECYEDLCEYFGGVTDILNNREDFKAWLGRIKWHIHKAEELYEKYEQEPCEDAISRQAVLDITWEEPSYTDALNVLTEVRDKIKELPPVNPQPKTEQFAKWVAREIFDDEWEYNKDAFAEIACRKLAKLGIVIRMGDEWELVEPQESEG